MRRHILRLARTAVTWCLIFLLTIDMAFADECCGGLFSQSCGSTSTGCGAYGYGNSCGMSSCGMSYDMGSCSSRCMTASYVVQSYETYSCSGCGYETTSGCGCAVDSSYVGSYPIESYVDGGCATSGCNGCGSSCGGAIVECAPADGYVSEGVVSDGMISEGVMSEGVMSDGVASESTITQEGPIVDDGTVISDESMYEGETIIEQPNQFTSEEISPALPAEPDQMPKPEMPTEAPEPADNGLERFEGSEPATPPTLSTTDPVAPTEPADSGLDDMFNGTPDATPADEAPADEPSPDEPSPDENELDDLFGSLNIRKWTDDTGNYSTDGRLASIGSDAIRIFKTNGRYCTVTYDRLSRTDFTYVQFIAKTSGNASVFQVADAR